MVVKIKKVVKILRHESRKKIRSFTIGSTHTLKLRDGLNTRAWYREGYFAAVTCPIINPNVTDVDMKVRHIHGIGRLDIISITKHYAGV